MNKYIVLPILVVLCVAGLSYAQFAPPKQSPGCNPSDINCNIAPPINVSAATQIKLGSIGIQKSGTIPSPFPSWVASFIKGGTLYIDSDTAASSSAWPGSDPLGLNKIFAINTDGPIFSYGVVSAKNIVTSESFNSQKLASTPQTPPVNRPVCATADGTLVLCDPVTPPTSPTVELTLKGTASNTMDADGNSGYSNSGSAPINVNWTSTQTSGCNALSGIGYTTGGATAGSDLSDSFTGSQTFSVGCNTLAGGTITDSKTYRQRRTVSLFNVSNSFVPPNGTTMATLDVNNGFGGVTYCAKMVTQLNNTNSPACKLQASNDWSGNKGDGVWGPFTAHTGIFTEQLESSSFVKPSCQEDVGFSIYVKCYSSQPVEERHNTPTTALEKHQSIDFDN